MTLHLCDNVSHKPICHEGERCPACLVIWELKDRMEQQDDLVVDLRAACSNHDKLVATLEECNAAFNRWDFGMSPAAIGICMSKIDAILAKAKGETIS